MKKVFPVLYKYTSKKQVQQWQIISEGDHFYTIEGIKDGKLTTSMPTYCKGKNGGKKNETTAEQQAEKEAAAKHQKKLDKGYNLVLTDEKKFFEPMLAFDFKDQKPIDFKAVRVFVQPKLDGLRCVNDGKLMSRNGKPYLACPHLENLGGQMLDGELYTHEYKHDFNKITSLCKVQKPTPEELKESAEKVQYWIYDFPVPGVFSERYEALKEYLAKNVNPMWVLVETHEVKSVEEIKEWHGKFLAEGYEGTIVRINNSEYYNGRHKSLLKFKDFVDEEFEIIGFEEGEGGRAGTIGKFKLKHDKYPTEWFESNVKGNFDYLKKVWKNRETYIGKKATVKYFNRTPRREELDPKRANNGDVPRFPYIIKLDRESYE